jgi:hypothetical protein
MKTAISPNLKYAMMTLTREKKYKVQCVSQKEIKIFSSTDLWRKMIHFHKFMNNGELLKRYKRRYNLNFK